MTRQEEMILEYESAWNKKADYPTKSLMLSVLQWADEHPVIRVGGAAKSYQRGYEDAVKRVSEWFQQNVFDGDDDYGHNAMWSNYGKVKDTLEQLKKDIER